MRYADYNIISKATNVFSQNALIAVKILTVKRKGSIFTISIRSVTYIRTKQP